MRINIYCLASRAVVMIAVFAVTAASLAAEPEKISYENRLRLIANPQPLLADFPEFVEPIREQIRYEAPPLIDGASADIAVRAWRFSYNARGIIEVPNRLNASETAVIIVHPWGIDDGQGWNTPQPAGAAFFCTPERNQIYRKHARLIVNPLLKSLRERARLVMYSLPGKEDPIRQKLYRSFRSRTTAEQRRVGAKELTAKLAAFDYNGGKLPAELELSKSTQAIDYFKKFPGLSAYDHYNNKGFWKLPIPVVREIEVAPDDVVIYDGDGYPALRDFLKTTGIRHVLLGGYATDKCVCATTAGYENLRKDFNVFLVGDATMATFPASNTPKHHTKASIANASLNLFITQVSWIKPVGEKRAGVR